MTVGTRFDRLGAEVAGRRGGLLSLALKTTALTVATAGLYSFWARTRQRRWLWSSLSVGGAPFEYRGEPLEKLMGFVVAALIVAGYLGLVVMVLVWLSFQLFHQAWAGLVAATVLVLPVYWFATYRGLRYLLNHTHWRGIGFSLVPGAWGYAGRTALWTMGCLATAGLLWPLRTHALWRYRVDRARWGGLALRHEGGARDLWAPFLPAWIVAWAGAGATWLIAVRGDVERAGPFAFLAVICVALLWLRWRVRSTEILWSGVRAGEARLTLSLRYGRVLGIQLLGWLIVAGLMLSIVIAVLLGYGTVIFAVAVSIGTEGQSTVGPNAYLVAAITAAVYLCVFLLRGAFRLAFVTLPLLRHAGEGLRIEGAAGLHHVHAAPRAHMADADGFANLFDMGSSI